MSETVEASFIDRTMRNLRYAWREIAGGQGEFAEDLPPEDLWRAEEQMSACIDARGGEVSARALAAKIGQGYLNLTETGRRRFLELLATRFDTDRKAVEAAAHDLTAAEEQSVKDASIARLRAALEPPRVQLLTRFNALPQGVKFLVDMRADLLPMAREDPALAGLDADMRRLLIAWFDVGFLEMEQITWNSPASLLEKLIAYEAVHAINDWEDMKDRLDVDRRCFAFFHPRMPEEPLIFVEVALVEKMADSVQALLDRSVPPSDPHEAGAAMFYSISNTQPGLAGISFGDFLIKKVVDRLAGEFPGLKTFSTLSPIPGFRRWMNSALGKGDLTFSQAESRRIRQALADCEGAETGGDDPAGLSDQAMMERALDRPEWWRHDALAKAVQAPLLRACAQYLLKAKGKRGQAADRVAHFHLSNGARVERLNWLGDVSANGLQQSAGLMINYLYKRDAIEDNHHAYATEGRIAASSAMRSLAKD